MKVIKSIIKPLKATVLAAVMLVIALLPAIGASAASVWGGENIGSAPGSTNLVCVRNNPALTAEYCDEYIDGAAPRALFNRFIDRPSLSNPAVLIDERNFVRICEIDPATDSCTGNYVSTKTLVPGRIYQVYIMFHNNGAQNPDGSPNFANSAHAARMSVRIPQSRLTANNPMNISSIISWTTPGGTAAGWPADSRSSVWDNVVVNSTEIVDIRYISGSATIHMNELDSNFNMTGTVVTQTLADMTETGGLFSENGTFLGRFDPTLATPGIVLDGIVHGCNEFSGWVTLRLEVTGVCEYNPNLPPDHPDCKPVGPPDSGGWTFRSTVVSLVALLTLSAFLVIALVTRKRIDFTKR